MGFLMFTREIFGIIDGYMLIVYWLGTSKGSTGSSFNLAFVFCKCSQRKYLLGYVSADWSKEADKLVIQHNIARLPPLGI